MGYKKLLMSWEQFSALPEPDRFALVASHYKGNANWFDAMRFCMAADYILVGGNTGTVYQYGRMDEYPTKEAIDAIAERTGEVIFPWTKDMESGEAEPEE